MVCFVAIRRLRRVFREFHVVLIRQGSLVAFRIREQLHSSKWEEQIRFCTMWEKCNNVVLGSLPKLHLKTRAASIADFPSHVTHKVTMFSSLGVIDKGKMGSFNAFFARGQQGRKGMLCNERLENSGRVSLNKDGIYIIVNI